MKKCQIIITNGKTRGSPVMLKFFHHLTKKTKPDPEPSLIFISPRFRITTMDYRRQVGVPEGKNRRKL
jgi:hypothetical protein